MKNSITTGNFVLLIFFCASFHFLSSSISSARIGENLEECIKRYGRPVEEPIEIKGKVRSAKFKSGRLFLTLTFKQEKCSIFEATLNPHGGVEGQVKRIPLTLEQVQFILSRMTDDIGWKFIQEQTSLGVPTAYWVSRDAKLIACWDKYLHTLYISPPDRGKELMLKQVLYDQ